MPLICAAQGTQSKFLRGEAAGKSDLSKSEILTAQLGPWSNRSAVWHTTFHFKQLLVQTYNSSTQSEKAGPVIHDNLSIVKVLLAVKSSASIARYVKVVTDGNEIVMETEGRFLVQRSESWGQIRALISVRLEGWNL